MSLDWSPEVPAHLVPILTPIGAPPASWEHVTWTPDRRGRPWTLTVTAGGTTTAVEVPPELQDDAWGYVIDAMAAHLGDLWNFDAAESY